jgi:tetratricopeptide (TPR) repeat protein
MKSASLRVITQAFFAVVLVSVLAGCATGAAYQGLNVRRLGGADSIGGTAAILALSGDGRGRHVEVLGQLGLSHLAAGMEDEARLLFDYLLEQEPLPTGDGPAEPGAARRAARGFTSVGRGYARLGDVDAAQRALSRAIETAATVPAEDVRIDLLLQIVDGAFTVDPPLTPTLQSAIQTGYIIQDFTLRTSFLLDLTERYRDESLPGNVGTLIQQALPAASSIADPWERGLALARIGRAQRQRAGQEGAEAAANLDRALEAVRNAGEIANATQALAAQELVAVLAEVDRRSEALRLIERIPLPHLQAVAYTDLAQSYFRADVRTVGFLMLTRAARNAASASTGLQRARGHIAIAVQYVEIDETDLALLQLDQAQRAAVSVDDADAKVSVLEEIAGIYLRLDRVDRVEALPEQLPGGTVPARLRGRIGVMLLDTARREPAATQFRAALSQLRTDGTGRVDFALQMSSLATRLGEVDLAVDIAAGIAEPVDRARALTAIVRHLPMGYEVSPTVRETLSDMRNGG